MSQSEFAGPNHTFPDEDPKHARLAIPMATKSYNAGNISKSRENSIKAKARKKLHPSERKQNIINNAIRGVKK